MAQQTSKNAFGGAQRTHGRRRWSRDSRRGTKLAQLSRHVRERFWSNTIRILCAGGVAAASPRVAGRRARRKTQGSDARSEDIARGSSVKHKEGTRSGQPARSVTRLRTLNVLNENPSLSLSGAHPYEPESDVISGVTESRPCSRLASLASIHPSNSNRQIRNRNEFLYATARPLARASGIEKEVRAGRWSRQRENKNGRFS